MRDATSHPSASGVTLSSRACMTSVGTRTRSRKSPTFMRARKLRKLGSDLAGGRPPTQLVEPRDLLDGALANESHREELTEREILFPPAETDRALDQQALSCAR